MLAGDPAGLAQYQRFKFMVNAEYSLAELDPAMTDNRIIVADLTDGKPLGPNEGPFKIVVPGGKRPARRIRMLTTLRAENAISLSESSPR